MEKLLEIIGTVITGGVVSVLTVAGGFIAAGLWIESETRSEPPSQGRNDPTEEDCEALCRQVRRRHIERCESLAYERDMANRARDALLVSLAAQAAAALAWGAVTSAAASGIGLLAVPFLTPLAIAAGIASTTAMGAAVGAANAWRNAIKAREDATRVLQEARDAMTNRCGQQRFEACDASLPGCSSVA